jgi:hypothetical protein
MELYLMPFVLLATAGTALMLAAAYWRSRMVHAYRTEMARRLSWRQTADHH